MPDISAVTQIEFEESELEHKRIRVASPPRLETGKEENNNVKHPGSSSRSDSVSPDMKRKRYTESPLDEGDEVRYNFSNFLRT